jgi:hypothetical protein
MFVPFARLFVGLRAERAFAQEEAFEKTQRYKEGKVRRAAVCLLEWLALTCVLVWRSLFSRSALHTLAALARPHDLHSHRTQSQAAGPRRSRAAQ